MRQRTKRAAAVLLGLAFTGVVAIALLPSDSTLAEQRRLNGVLAGKTRKEVQLFAGRQPYLYLSKDQWAKEIPGFRPQSDEDAAVGYWVLGPDHYGGIRVTFDQNGVATDVSYRSFSGPIQSIRRWSPF